MKIRNLTVSTYTVPTDEPESDGTLAWNSTTMVLVELHAGDFKGIGYTYAHEAAGVFIFEKLKKLVLGKDAMDIEAIRNNLIINIRNEGNCGIAFMAVSAIDSALWDLKAKVLNKPLFKLLGAASTSVEVYGSGGFTSYSTEKLRDQLSGWANEGFKKVKMKIGRHPDKDLGRVKSAKHSIGSETELMVDANGAYELKQAHQQALAFADFGVNWFEEPVSSDNLKGLNHMKIHAPAGMKIAAGEYGFNLYYFLKMLEAGAVDVLQADATRCGGLSGFLKAGHLAEAFQIPFSFHCAPSLHLHAAMALESFTIGEYFHDHVRIEQLFFDGFVQPIEGRMKPDATQPGMGLHFKHQDAEKYKSS